MANSRPPDVLVPRHAEITIHALQTIRRTDKTEQAPMVRPPALPISHLRRLSNPKGYSMNVAPFEQYRFLSEMKASDAKVALTTVADGDANSYTQYGESSFVARVGKIVLAGDTHPDDKHLQLRAFPLRELKDAERRYDEVLALYDAGGF
jgi:hypothetical protein